LLRIFKFALLFWSYVNCCGWSLSSLGSSFMRFPLMELIPSFVCRNRSLKSGSSFVSVRFLTSFWLLVVADEYTNQLRDEKSRVQHPHKPINSKFRVHMKSSQTTYCTSKHWTKWYITNWQSDTIEQAWCISESDITIAPQTRKSANQKPHRLPKIHHFSSPAALKTS